MGVLSKIGGVRVRKTGREAWRRESFTSINDGQWVNVSHVVGNCHKGLPGCQAMLKMKAFLERDGEHSCHKGTQNQYRC